MRAKRRLLLLIVALILLLFAAVAAQAAPGTGPFFSDVAQDDPNTYFIKYLAQNDLIKGFPDGTFRPGEGLTRAQAASILARAAGVTTGAGPQGFNDVPVTHWAAGSIGAAVAAGLVQGYTDGTFRPDATLTRAEGISMVLGLSRQPDAGVNLPELDDVSPGHWAARRIAVGLASGMVDLPAGEKNFRPQAPFTRGDLTRALGILLTKDPLLYQHSLPIELSVLKGKVLIIRAGFQEQQEIRDTAEIKPGDIIKTGSEGLAAIEFPDGTGLRLEENTELAVKEARGRSVITADGEPGASVDWLALDLKKGKMFGALASIYRSDAAGQQSLEQNVGASKLTGYPLVASREMSNALIAAAGATNSGTVLGPDGKPLPWWQAAQAKRVRVKVDMPWGVAVIRGTFWENIVESDGLSITSLLLGEGEVTSGGRTVKLKAGQRTRIASSTSAPDPAAPLTSEDRQEWSRVGEWVQARAKDIQENREMVPQDLNQEQTGPQAPEVIDRVNDALHELGGNLSIPSSPSNTGGGGGGGGGGGSGPDNSPPRISSADPDDSDEDVSVDKIITLTFNENIFKGGNFSGIVLMRAGSTTVDVTVETEGNVLTLDPAGNLEPGATYTVVVPAGSLKDKKDNTLEKEYNFNFTTKTLDTEGPEVSGTTPADGDDGVGLSSSITVRFSENVLEGDYFDYIILENGQDSVTDLKISLKGKKLTIKPSDNLTGNTAYTVYIPSGAVKDIDGNPLERDYSFSFTTEEKDAEAPEVTGTVPANGEQDVKKSTPITVSFSEDVQKGNSFGGITLKAGGDVVAGVVAHISDSALTIEPPEGLAFNTVYTVLIPAGAVKDKAGNALEEDYSFTFETAKNLPGTISGLVIDAVNGEPLEAASVELYSTEDNSLVTSVESSSNGKYVLEDVLPGEYTVIAKLDGYIENSFELALKSGDDLANQNIVLSPELYTGEIRIVLTWGQTPNDLDAHLQGPLAGGERFHVYHENPDVEGVNLDVDDQDSYGPETITISELNEGIYRYSVVDYSNMDNNTSTALSLSGAEVRVYREDREPRVFQVPKGAGTLWRVFELDGSGEITPLNNMEYATSVTMTVTNPSTGGFALEMSPAAPGLRPEELIITDDQDNVIPVENAVTLDNGVTYKITAELEAGKTYTVSINSRVGYVFDFTELLVPAQVQL